MVIPILVLVIHAALLIALAYALATRSYYKGEYAYYKGQYKLYLDLYTCKCQSADNWERLYKLANQIDAFATDLGNLGFVKTDGIQNDVARRAPSSRRSW